MKVRALVPEVVQTSAMDCGPAALKAVLEGFGIHVSYGRLREACQTEVDGTSIDTLEEVAKQLGLEAEQIMIPPDHLLLAEARALPALAVVRLPSGVTHFVVVWSLRGSLVQVMNPASGRRWMLRASLLRDLYLHTFPVPAAGWRDWAASDDFTRPLKARMAALGVGQPSCRALVDEALQLPGWEPIAALDAATRMAAALVRGRAARRGRQAESLIRRCIEPAHEGEQRLEIPTAYWSVRPAPAGAADQLTLLLRGAVLIRFRGVREAAPDGEPVAASPLPPELVAALTEEPPRPGRELLAMLARDGRLPVVAALGAAAVAAAGVVLEALLFRGLLDVGRFLGLMEQRLAAAVALLVMLAATTLLELPLAAIVLRSGRRLEGRLRMAFLEVIPRLSDRYFHSRLSSDMAERAHSVHTLRALPSLVTQLLRAGFLLVFTTAGLIWLDPGCAPLALPAAVLAAALPMVAQRLLVERDLKLRTHGGALSRFYLDATLGLVPIRCHGAGSAVRREHEALLVEWCRAGLGLLRGAVAVEGVLAVSGVALAVGLLADHLRRAEEPGAVLLFVYWALALPALGQRLAMVVRQYPAQRNITLRLFEPLGAPLEATAEGEPWAAGTGGVTVSMRQVTVKAGGHTILEGVDLELDAGAHVAVVGPSGAGKSSLVGLLLGWHRPASGVLEVDGEPLGGTALEALRRQLVWVDPSVQLWNRTLVENLRYGSSGSAMVPEALEEADLHGVLERLPAGLQTVLGEGGALVAGGEGQRVRLGRAMMRSGIRLAILDEPFRGLDREQRRRLLAAARKRWRGATLLCVTHDVAETMDFDRVLVLERGRIVEQGRPAELAESSESRYGQLLAAEAAVRRQLWEGPGWRHVHLADGKLSEDGRAPG